MKFNSLQSRFLTAIISAIVLITAVIGTIYVHQYNQFVASSTQSLVQTTCEKEASQINSVFGDMEKLVKIMETYALDMLSQEKAVSTQNDWQPFVKKIDIMFADVIANTEGALAYYLRLDPSISNNDTGVFCSKLNKSDEFQHMPLTDLSLYARDDRSHVGWWWEPKEAGEPIWMAPYYNLNNDALMISYVIPLYFQNSFVGVVGIDFDYGLLTERLRDIRFYENGFAYLEKDGYIAYHKDHQPGTSTAAVSDEYLQSRRELKNGMTLVLCASYADIEDIRNKTVLQIIVVALLLVILFSVVAIIMVKKIVSPLNRLTDAAKSLSDGVYDIEIGHSSAKEIEILNQSFAKMAIHLKEHNRLMHLQAYRDSLTGLRNTTSYKTWVNDFDDEIKSSKPCFGVVVFDINYLKETNDSYGHDIGNKLILAAAHIIADTFKRSPVFRIGGDEFLVILQNRDYTEYEALIKKFENECSNKYIMANDKTISVSVAKGAAFYNQDDKSFTDVFNRADDAMYENKRSMKSKT